MARDVFAKGLKKYYFDTIEEELAAAWDSPYRHWWALMCCSRDYWWVCQQRGDTLDPRLRRVYEAFGDKCWQGFDIWWRFAARDEFVEQVAPERIDRIHKYFNIDVEDFRDETKWMFLRVPMNITEAKLVSEFKEILRTRPTQAKIRQQTSNFPIRRYKSLNLEVYRKATEVWHAVNQTQDRRQRTRILKDDGDSLYQIGVGIDLSAKLVIQDSDTNDRKAKKRNAMKVAMSRMLTRAEALIQNIEVGIFPSYEPVPVVPRWTEHQQSEMDAAIASGKWKPKYMNHQEWAVRFAKIHQDEVRRRESERNARERRRLERPETGRS